MQDMDSLTKLHVLSEHMGLEPAEETPLMPAVPSVAPCGQVITAGDMSCLMHLEGLARRQKMPFQIKHIAEILNAYE